MGDHDEPGSPGRALQRLAHGAEMQELCLGCGEVTSTDTSPSAGATIYYCAKCGKVVDWEPNEDESIAAELRKKKTGNR